MPEAKDAPHQRTDSQLPSLAVDIAAKALDGLTQKQKRYVEGRLSGMTKLAAARAAGYETPEVNAYRLDQNPRIRAALESITREATRNLALSRESVLEGLLDAVHTAATSAELTAAWREIGRVIGAYEPEKREININYKDLSPDKLARMSDKELMELGVKFEGQYDSPDDAIDAEYEVLQDALEPPKPIDYDRDVDAEELGPEGVRPVRGD